MRPAAVWPHVRSCSRLAYDAALTRFSDLPRKTPLDFLSAWWTARTMASLAGVPDASTITLAMAARLDYDPTLDPAVGRALYEGTVAGAGKLLRR